MLRRLFTCVSVLSLVMWFATVASLALSYNLDPRAGGIRVFHNIRVGVFGGRFSVYNQIYPYGGSIIAITGSPGPRRASFDFAGVYYRHFTWPGHYPGGSYWTLTIPLLYPLLLSAALPLAWLAARVRRHRKNGICRRCGYDLRVTPERCPECGTPAATRAGPA